jgi:hypothetical protein
MPNIDQFLFMYSSWQRAQYELEGVNGCLTNAGNNE